MEKYEVRFGGYRYNTPSNDVYPCVKSFENLNGVWFQFLLLRCYMV